MRTQKGFSAIEVIFVILLMLGMGLYFANTTLPLFAERILGR
jgi:hypothetical protein